MTNKLNFFAENIATDWKLDAADSSLSEADLQRTFQPRVEAHSGVASGLHRLAQQGVITRKNLPELLRPSAFESREFSTPEDMPGQKVARVYPKLDREQIVHESAGFKV